MSRLAGAVAAAFLAAAGTLCTAAPVAAEPDEPARTGLVTVFTDYGPALKVAVPAGAWRLGAGVDAVAEPPRPTPEQVAEQRRRTHEEQVRADARAEADRMRARAAVVDVTDFPNGVIPAEYLCAVPWTDSHRLECSAAADLVLLDAEYRLDHDGAHIPFTDSYRTLQGQYDCRDRKGSMCATPGTSNHGWGTAVDFAGGVETFGSDAYWWMDEHAPAFGWVHPAWAKPWGSNPEAWHWEHEAR